MASLAQTSSRVRLEATAGLDARLLRTAEREEGGYGHVHEFVADLEVIDASLRAHRGERIANGRLAALRRRDLLRIRARRDDSGRTGCESNLSRPSLHLRVVRDLHPELRDLPRRDEAEYSRDSGARHGGKQSEFDAPVL